VDGELAIFEVVPAIGHLTSKTTGSRLRPSEPIQGRDRSVGVDAVLAGKAPTSPVQSVWWLFMTGLLHVAPHQRDLVTSREPP